MGFKLLHKHGEVGPRGKASYIQFGTFKTRKAAKKAAVEKDLDGHRIVPKSSVKKTKFKGLVYVG